MSGIVVCTDSSALLTDRDVARLGIQVVPIAIVLNGEHVQGDLDVDDFYARLSAGTKVVTSQPSPANFAAVYEAAATRGAQGAISIHLDERVSGTAASAESAALASPIPVTVVATETVSFGVGICARAAAEALEAGLPPDAAADIARRLGSVVQNVFVAPGAPTGRVSDSAGWAVATFAAGTTRVLSTCASAAEAVEAMVEHVLRSSPQIRVAVGHAAAAIEPAADDLAMALAGSTAVRGLERYRVGPPVGAHTGVSSFGAFWWPA